MNCRERFLAACRQLPLDRPPVWIMRQAGRYLPEYRKIRSRHTFSQMCKTSELAAEVTLQPIRRFGMDAAILFSDILVISEAMGVSVEYEDGGPRLAPAITTKAALDKLKTPNVEKNMASTFEAIRLVRRQLGNERALIGFAGAPYTLASYMVEGVGNKDLAAIKRLQYKEPELLSALLEQLAQVVTEFLRLQVRSGVDAVQLFDTWAGNLSPSDYHRFALPYSRSIIEALEPEGIPIILYINGISSILEFAASSGATVIGIDWRLNLESAYARIDGSAALQGNLDPLALFASPSQIKAEVHRMHRALSVKTGHIFNLGHGILPSTPLAGAAAFVRAVKELA